MSGSTDPRFPAAHAAAAVLLAGLLGACVAPQTRLPQVSETAAEEEARKQRELYVQRLLESQRKLFRVGYRLAAAGGVNTQGQFTELGMRAGAGTYSVDFEREADYVGMYFMAQAGYDTENAANFWRRMAVAHPRSITYKTTHPTTSERFVGLEAAVVEVRDKQARGAPLRPVLEPRPEPAVRDADAALESQL